jgi:hypothetical protein
MTQPWNPGSAVADIVQLQAVNSAMPDIAPFLIEKRCSRIKNVFMSTPNTPIGNECPAISERRSRPESGLANQVSPSRSVYNTQL